MTMRAHRSDRVLEELRLAPPGQKLVPLPSEVDGVLKPVEKPKIENYLNFKRRWRFHRVMVYMRALRAAGLQVHPMRSEGG
jgi:hypothetical protein